MGTKADMYMASLLNLRAGASAGGAGDGRVVEAELREDVAGAFVNPEAASILPQVLIIGDSISIGYTEPVRENLKGSAEVFRPPVNCQHTGYGLSQIKTWLGTGKWDVIHFNFGIWDTHMLDAKGNLLSGSMEGDSAPATDGIGSTRRSSTRIIERDSRHSESPAPARWASPRPSCTGRAGGSRTFQSSTALRRT